MQKCIIDGCSNEGVHNFGVRCRRPNASAIGAPNTNAYLCDEHAKQGCVIDITITPTANGNVRTNVKNGNRIESRTIAIAHEANE